MIFATKPPDEAILHSQGPVLNFDDFVVRIPLSVAAGLVVAALYYFTLGRRKRDMAAMPLTLVLLSLLVCMVTLIVNGSVALAFTLGGTLAIVRFRAVVDDTRDTAYVIAAVVVGMGMGTGAKDVVYLGLPMFGVLCVASMFLLTSGPRAGHRIVVRVANDRDPDDLTKSVFATCGVEATLISLETAKQGTAIEAIYGVKQLNAATILKLMTALKVIEGVQGVEVKPI